MGMQWALVGLFVVIGLVFAGAGLRRVVRRQYLRRHGCRATGTVVAIRQATVEASAVFAPVVAFPTEQGGSRSPARSPARASTGSGSGSGCATRRGTLGGG